MADKLDWLGKHFVFIRHIKVTDAVSAEGYKIPPDMEDLFEGVSDAPEMVFRLAEAGMHKNACALMAYIAHRRAAVWWGYRCVCSLYEELRQNPPKDIDMEKPPEPPPPPPYFNFDVPKPDPAMTAAMDAAVAAAGGKAAESAALVNPAMKRYVAEGVEKAFRVFEASNGIHPMALLEKLGNRMKQDPYAISPDSPIFRMKRELTAELEVQRAKTIAEIKAGHIAAGLPSSLNKIPKLEAHKEKLRANVLDAVYGWVAAPNAENAQKCMDMGNKCIEEPAGMLSLAAFWAFGNLAPQLEQVIHTPPGLAANGVDKAILMCAVQKGGIRKIKERYELYFNMGVDVLSGKDNWEESLASGKPPHENLSPASAPPPPESGGGAEANATPDYKRWKPENHG
jgi:hypothetical protein